MKRFLILLLAVYLLGCPMMPIPEFYKVEAQALIGFDTLGLGHPNFPCDVFIKQLPQDSAVGYLAHTFGEDYSCLKKVLASGKVKAFRVHMVNNTCYRGARCGSYETQSNAGLSEIENQFSSKSGKIWAAAGSRASQINQIALAYPNVKCYTSALLEHNLSQGSALNAVNLMKDRAPACTPVNSPCNGCGHNVYLQNFVNEAHGARVEKKGNWIVSHDGESAENQNTRSYLKRNESTVIRFIWVSMYNLRVDGDFVDPRKREKKPSGKELQSIVRLATDRQDEIVAPKFNCNFTALEKPILLKTHAEDKGTNDNRANKPLFITREKSNDVSIVDVNGKSIAKLTYYGGYGDGFHRYYSGHRGGSDLFGWEIAKIAKETTGTASTWVKSKNTCYGPLHPTYRKGYFQD